MSRITWALTAAIVILCSGALLRAPAGWSAFAAAQEEAVEEELSEEERNDEVGSERLERRLNEIEKLIDRAEQRGDEERVRELRREGERLLDRLEEIERARTDVDEEEGIEEQEEWERHASEIEIHRLELEIERLHQELNAARQEASVRLAHIATDRFTSVSYAISQSVEQFEEESAIDFLADMLEETEDIIVQRMIRHRLNTLYHHAEQPDAARRELRALILGE